MIPGQMALPVPALDPDRVDLDQVDRVTYLLEQRFCYDYPQPVERLRHRLVVLPPVRHGDQHLRARRLEVHGAPVVQAVRRDTRGNTVVRLSAERVECVVQFGVRVLVERVRRDGPARLPADATRDPRLLRHTRLTAPDSRLRELAHEIGRETHTPTELAAAIARTVHTTMTYEYGATSIQTSAAEALALGRGVCQDSAHVMLALCRLLGLPARYVSGHLLGQGGTHAWVEVVVAHDDHALALPFDPCAGGPTTARYLTVATGRDYADVPPTSGSYLGPAGGRLTTERHVTVLAAA